MSVDGKEAEMRDELDELMETEAYLQMEGGDTSSGKSECTGPSHLVTADHPTLRRPDKKFTGSNSFLDAIEYAEELKTLGYENILIAECGN